MEIFRTLARISLERYPEVYMTRILFKLFDMLVIRSWWVILFTLLCFMLFEQAVKKRDREYHKLLTHLTELQIEKENAHKRHEALILQINSESDPAWIELVLMRELGMVPEGYIKGFFEK
jgi:hypothetical protein